MLWHCSEFLYVVSEYMCSARSQLTDQLLSTHLYISAVNKPPSTKQWITTTRFNTNLSDVDKARVHFLNRTYSVSMASWCSNPSAVRWICWFLRTETEAVYVYFFRRRCLLLVCSVFIFIFWPFSFFPRL